MFQTFVISHVKGVEYKVAHVLASCKMGYLEVV